EYFDGAGGDTETKTSFGTTTSFGIPDIGGQPAAVMKVPGDKSNKIGYIMRHGISPNGGGSLVNKYTIVMDVYVDPSGSGAGSLIQTDTLNNTSDGDIFHQGSNFGQGAGGYEGTGQFTIGAWHRVAWAVDLTASPATITKYVDGIKQDDWNPSDALDGRRALREFAILFADGDQDERLLMYVNSVQVHDRKLSDTELEALGEPTAVGLPLLSQEAPQTPVALAIAKNGSNVTITWPGETQGFVLESTPAVGTGAIWTPVAGVVGNSATIPAASGNRFYRLRK
ncbi:MAG: hypothetical protein ACO1QB_01815, partial [Verrucomicrobiales bacterium]